MLKSISLTGSLLKRIVSCSRIKYLLKRNYGTGSSIFHLEDRGIWSDRFPSSCLEFEQGLTSQSLTVYSGFDPTSDSLHIGNLLVLNALIYFQRNGHSVLALVGGATGRVGDPSGKKKERSILKEDVVEQNSASIKADIERIFSNHEKYIWKKDKPLKPARILDNYDWYRNVNILDFFRNVGKAMRMGTLLTRSTIQTRLSANEPLSYTEFSYQILQAYDWLHLYKNYGCTVQIGGSDQMGNIHTGHDLISRIEDVQVTGLTVPLITSETGDKMGKSSGTRGQVWLNPAKTHPFEFYQFFVRTKDSDVEKYLKLLTFIPLPEIEAAMQLHKDVPEKLRPQKKLAEHLTLLVHGEEGLIKAKQGTELLYGGNSAILADMKAEDIMELFTGCNVKSLLLQPGTSVLDIAMKAECFSNEALALKMIEAGGFYVNQARVTQPFLALIPGIHILPNGISLLRVGKKNYYIVKWMSSNLSQY